MQSKPNKPEVGVLTPTKTTGIYYRLKKNGSKTFYIRYTNTAGKRPFEACSSFESAKSRLADVTGKKARGEIVAQVGTTVATLIEGWRGIRTCKPRTCEMQDSNIRIYIEPHWSHMKARDVTKVGLQEWLLKLKRHDGSNVPLNDGTRALILATLSSILDYGVDAGVLAINPVKSLGRKQKPHQGTIPARILEAGELEALLAGCEKFPWLRDIIAASLYGALRLGEVCGLKWGDVDLDGNTITVRRQLGKDGIFGTPKGGGEATIPLLPELRKVIVTLRLGAEDKTATGPVFTNSLGGHRHPRDVQRSFHKARTRAGLSTEPRAFRYHDLRHTAVSRLINAGMAPVWTQHFARHANLSTTLAYAHDVQSDENLEKAAQALAGLTS